MEASNTAVREVVDANFRIDNQIADLLNRFWMGDPALPAIALTRIDDRPPKKLPREFRFEI